jgi:hypothetical protein
MFQNNMAQRFKMTGFVFNIFIIMIQYIIIINSSDKINIMKQHIGKIDENKTNYNFEDRFDKFDNFVIKMVIKTVDYIHNKITEQPTINPLPTVSPPLTISPPPTNNFNKITHLIPHYDNSLPYNEILHNHWCPMCACKNSKSDLCREIIGSMHSLIINLEGICSLCPTKYLIDVEEHINMDSAFLNKDLKYNKYFNHIDLFDTNTQQNQLDCNAVFRQSFYKELKSSAIYTEMIGCINNPNSNYHISEFINPHVKSLFVIRWFFLEYHKLFNHFFFFFNKDALFTLREALLISVNGKIIRLNY